MHKSLSLVLTLAMLASLALAGCAYGPQDPTARGATAGGAVGATAGALLDDDNRWRGGVIGGALGAVLGGAMGQISDRAARQAAQQNQPVYYQNTSGTRRVEAYPGKQQGNCQKVTEKHYENGQVVKVVEREVCD